MERLVDADLVGRGAAGGAGALGRERVDLLPQVVELVGAEDLGGSAAAGAGCAFVGRRFCGGLESPDVFGTGVDAGKGCGSGGAVGCALDFIVSDWKGFPMVSD